MDKSPEAFRTISEAAESMDLPQHVLRFWETRFPQIKPLKRAGGRRYYRPDDIELLRAIKRMLYDEGYTIKGVQKMLRENGAQALARPEAMSARAARPPRPELNPPMAAPTPRTPEVTVAPAPAPIIPVSLAASEMAALRCALRELREAERLLAQARSA